MLLPPRQQQYQVNKYFTLLCFLLPPAFGSAVSIVFNGGGIWALVTILAKKKRFNPDRDMIALSIALYAYCAAYLIASMVNGALIEDAPKLVRLIPLALFPFCYSTWCISDKATIKRATLIGGMIACYSALIVAAYQFYSLGMRAEGGAGNAIVFATVTCLAALLCLAGAIAEHDKLRLLSLGACLAGVLAVVLSGSRIMWVAFLIGGAIVLLVNRRNLRQRISLRGVVLAVTAVAITATVGFRTISSRIDSMLSDLSAFSASGQADTSLGLRFTLWDIAVKAFHEMPFFGHGIMNTRSLIATQLNERLGMSDSFTHLHNGFLTASVEAGLFGALALAAIFFIAAKNAASVLRTSSDPTERYGATMIWIVVATYLIGGMTGILLGHDILDAVLMIFLIVGTYLSSGTSLPESGQAR